MADRFIPNIGATGFYNLGPPFTLPAGERYSCKAIRKISEQRSLGVDVFKEFYETPGVSEEIYLEDSAIDSEIVSLVADGGRWIHVPSRFILGYPNMNGVPYHGMAFHVALPAFPVTQDFSHVVQKVQDAVRDGLGVTCAVTPIETTRASLVPSTQHLLLTTNRQALSLGTTSSSQAAYWKRAYDDLLLRHNHLLDHFPLA